MGELDHRVKNTLANILALMTLAGQNATSVEEFIESIRRRIFSMSRAHNLLTAGRWHGISIHDLLRKELDPYDNAVNTSAEGPDVVLEPKAALALSMAIHELATNAAKYGAFSTPDGKVQVRWTCTAANDIQLTWREFEGPEVHFPSRRGFGSMLIEQVLGFESDGRATLHFESGGVRCEITLPAAAIAIEESIVGRSLQPSKPTAAPSPALGDIGAPNSRRRRVLVVEDSAMVAMLLRIMIASIGWDMVGPAHGLEQACAMARAELLDAAILDIDLRGEMSWEVAELLKARDVPFLFGTGYGRDAPLPTNLHGSEIVEKPFDMDELKSRLLALVAARDDLRTSKGPDAKA